MAWYNADRTTLFPYPLNWLISLSTLSVMFSPRFLICMLDIYHITKVSFTADTLWELIVPGTNIRKQISTNLSGKLNSWMECTLLGHSKMSKMLLLCFFWGKIESILLSKIFILSFRSFMKYTWFLKSWTFFKKLFQILFLYQK